MPPQSGGSTYQHELPHSMDIFNPLSNTMPSANAMPSYVYPSPPSNPSFNSSPHIGASQTGQNEPLTPPFIENVSEKGLISGFYSCFHLAHPFLPPQSWMMQSFKDKPNSHLELAMRYIGSLYVPSTRTSDYLLALQLALAEESALKDGTMVQSLLLLAIGLHMSDGEVESADFMRATVALATDLGMNKTEFASHYGAGSPVLEESWRRTWWEVWVCDGMFCGVNPENYQLGLFGIENELFLPCEERDFLSGVGTISACLIRSCG